MVAARDAPYRGVGRRPLSPEPPEPFAAVLEREDGRGLALVRACADVWGWQPLVRDGSRGKFAWCEVGAA